MSTQPQSKPSLDLSERAMLVDLTFHDWNPIRRDQSESDEIAERKHADRNSLRLYKNLIDGRHPAAKRLRAARRAVKRYHDTMARPWSQRGVSIMRSSNFTDYDSEMRTRLIPEFDKAADEFVKQLPKLIEDAKKRLGDVFKESDYPDAEEVRSQLGIDIRYYPVPSAGDWRVHLGQGEVDRLRQEIELENQAMLATMTMELSEKTVGVVNDMLKRLKALDSGEVKRAYSSIVGNVAELAQSIPNLNIANDPRLDELGRELENELCQFSVKELKEDDEKRKATMEKAEAILSKMEGFWT